MPCRPSMLFPPFPLHCLSLPTPPDCFQRIALCFMLEDPNETHQRVCNLVSMHSISQWSICEPPSEIFLSILSFKKSLAYFEGYCVLFIFLHAFSFALATRKLRQIVGSTNTTRTWRATNMYCTILSPMLIFHLDWYFWYLYFCFYFSIVIYVLKSP